MNRNLRTFLATTTLATGAACMMWLAPSAYAADEGVVLSSTAPNTAVSGTATTTLSADSLGYVWMEVDFPVADYTGVMWGVAGPSQCAAYNVVLKVEGTVVPIQGCQSRVPGFTDHMLFVDSLASGELGDRVTLSWGSTFMSTNSSGATSLGVWDPSTGFRLSVVPTVAPSASTEPEHSIAYHQALRMPVLGTCADVADADFAWGTGLTGGWKPSWQQWVNDGQGGPVCQRTIAYVNGGWSVV
jgi:hypothetical protein